MSYRPITDFWLLTRAALKEGKKYYGAYLGGFPERARILLGVPLDQPLLHACGGMARYYKYPRGFGPRDKTADIDAGLEPDFVCDLTMEFPSNNPGGKGIDLWEGILIDPPYSMEDSLKYAHREFPKPNLLMKLAIQKVNPGGKVGIIHYVIPACPKNAKFVACVGIGCGFNNRVRVFTVFERLT